MSAFDPAVTPAEAELAELLDRVAVRYPDVPRAELELLVRQAYTQFEDARVRTYVPLLAERWLRELLRTTIPHQEHHPHG